MTTGLKSLASWLPVLLIAALGLLAFSDIAFAENRFPRPQFESGYEAPEHQEVGHRLDVPPIVDVLILIASLGVAAWLGIWKRSRRGLFVIVLFGIAYFGFFRAGCVCPIGATQNVVFGIVNPEYALPWLVLAFFAIPLIFAAILGRSFCAGVCPLGAIQDIFQIKDYRVPKWLAGPLSLLPYVYLGAAVLFVVTGAGFIICRYDPFVGFFRMDGPAFMLISGGILLGIGMFFGRPYCRFLCPYGVLLGWLSKLNWKHVQITPTSCITCGLCADACPYDAILPPKPKATDRKTIAKLLALTPVLMLVGAIIGLLVGPALAQFHPSSTTLEGLPQPVPEEVISQFRVGTAILGAFIGLMGGVLLLREPMRKPTLEYTIDPVTCLSCARCFTSCPKESEFRLNTINRTPAAIPIAETVPATEENADVVARS